MKEVYLVCIKIRGFLKVVDEVDKDDLQNVNPSTTYDKYIVKAIKIPSLY